MINEIKRHITSNTITNHSYEILEYLSNDVKNTFLRKNKNIYTTKQIYFIKTNDFTCPNIKQIPIIMERKSRKKNDNIIDSNLIKKKYGIGSLSLIDLENNDQLLYEFLLNILFKWIIGGHVYLDINNFFILNDKIYSLYDDIYLQFDILTDFSINDNVKNKLIEFLNNNFYKVYQSIKKWENNIINNKFIIITLLKRDLNIYYDHEDYYDYFLLRTKALLDKDFIIQFLEYDSSIVNYYEKFNKLKNNYNNSNQSVENNKKRNYSFLNNNYNHTNKFKNVKKSKNKDGNNNNEKSKLNNNHNFITKFFPIIKRKKQE